MLKFDNLEKSAGDKTGRSAVEEAACFVDFALKTLGAQPNNVRIMAEKSDFELIVREFRDWKGGKNST